MTIRRKVNQVKRFLVRLEGLRCSEDRQQWTNGSKSSPGDGRTPRVGLIDTYLCLEK